MRHNFNDELRMMSAKVVNNFLIKKSPLVEKSTNGEGEGYASKTFFSALMPLIAAGKPA